MKSYRPTRELLAEIKRTLDANKPSFHHSPLQDVIDLLCRGRHYTWMGIYLAVSDKNQLLSSGRDSHPGDMALPETRSKILVSIKLGRREFGILDVESDYENAFSSEDRVLLERVATVLAQFLAVRGKYLVRKARTAAASPNLKSQARGPKAAIRKTVRSAAVGEK